MSNNKKFFSSDYLREVAMKIIDNLLSVKVWCIIGLLTLTTIMVYDGMLTGAQFTSINGLLITTVMAMREVWKTSKIRALSENNEVDKIDQMKA